MKINIKIISDFEVTYLNEGNFKLMVCLWVAHLTDTQIFDLKSGSYSCELWEHELH